MTDARDSTFGAYAVYRGSPARRTRDSVFGAAVVYAGPRARRTRESVLGAEVVYSLAPYNIPRNSVLGAYVVWAPGPNSAARTRAWTYTLDGHTFYVLDLGTEGTFLYDVATQQWCQFETAGGVGWNMRGGVMWGPNNRIVGGDTIQPTLWELDPDTFTDEGFRSIEHVVTGGVVTRSRVFLSVEELRLMGSLGRLTDAAATTISMRFSDDNGQSWSPAYVEVLTPGNFSGDQGELVWRSLGSFMSPGRVFEIRDIGGMLRIDGADLFVNDFDDDQEVTGR